MSFKSKNTVKTFYLQNGHLAGFEAKWCVYCVLPFVKENPDFFLETPQQVRLTCYLVSNFLATLSLKLISFHSNLRLGGNSIVWGSIVRYAYSDIIQLLLTNMFNVFFVLNLVIWGEVDYILCHSARHFRVFSFK